MASARNLGQSRIVGGMRFRINRARSPKWARCDFSVETSTVKCRSGAEWAKEDHEWRACQGEKGVSKVWREPFHGNFSDSGIGGQWVCLFEEKSGAAGDGGVEGKHPFIRAEENDGDSAR